MTRPQISAPIKYDEYIGTRKQFALSCDWLQLHIKHRQDFLEYENPYYLFKRTGQSKVFRDIYEIRDIALDKEIGIYCTNANENIMSPSAGILKFNNRELYSNENLKEYVQKVLDRLHFKLIGITRFDIAFDFLEFQNNYKPEKFLKDYVTENIFKVNVNKRSRDGGKGSLVFTQTKNGIRYESISFGSKKSNVTAKMYNKTLEMVNNRKPWIERVHKANFDMTQDIWRIEFSISSMRAFFENEGGEINYNSLDILDMKNMYGIFIGLFKKNFRFKEFAPGQRVTRMKDIHLWDFDFSFTELRKVALNPIIKQSSRSERIFIKKLDSFNKEFRLFDENFEYTAKEMIGKIIDMHDLHDWAKDHSIDYDRKQTGYMDNIYDMKKITSEERLMSLQKSFDEQLWIQESEGWVNLDGVLSVSCIDEGKITRRSIV